MTEEFAPIEWVDELPPPSTKGRELFWFAEQLKANPGRWAKLPRKHNYVTQIRRGRIGAFAPEGAFEAQFRKPLGESRGHTYVRYVGLNPDANGAVKRPAGRDERIDQLQRERRGASIT